MSSQVSVVMYGKHPAFGDFLNLGLPPEALAVLDAWLDRVLPELCQRLGPNWQTVWDAADPICFWIGPSLLGVPLTGIFITSADKVGRRFPFILGLGGKMTPLPVDSSFESAPYGALKSHIAGFQMPENDHRDGRALLAGFEVPDIEASAWQSDSGGTLWAQRRDGDLQRLMADARSHDAVQAQFTRSHWWRETIETQDTGWLGCNGLPDAAAFEWLLTK